ncbi:MAG: type II toxin-antitoxin system VapC family toxin [Actinobacteria bacterium]|nr:type II toxin-antitoxin system VapC family toxin [Actinomycetota bacterium]
MILDTSALVAVLFEEPGFQELERKMLGTSVIAIGLRESMDIVVIPFEQPHWETAADAFIRFGKGRHPAALNYGDCMAYATARLADRPLLFVGDDFARTDVEAA